MRRIWLPALLMGLVWIGPAPAGIIFGRKPAAPKPTPAERVAELVTTVKADGDENKRGAAAVELRQFDPAQFPEIVPVLLEVLAHDQKPSVRAEVAETLGKIRPVNPAIGQALEATLAKDASMRVRIQARSSLMGYYWAGYKGATPPKKEDLLQQSKEPPLADPEPASPPTQGTTKAPATKPLVVPWPGDARTVPVVVPPTKGAVPLPPASIPSPLSDKGSVPPVPLPAGPSLQADPTPGPVLAPPAGPDLGGPSLE